MRSFRWVSYGKVDVLYSGKLGNRLEARASDLRSYPGLWWIQIKLRLYEGKKVSTLRGPAQLADLQEALCVPTYNLTNGVVESLTCYCGSVPPTSPIFFFMAVLLLLSIEPTTAVPSRVASQWRERPSIYNGDHNSSKIAGGWSPGTYHTDDTFRVRADDTALRSTLLVSALVASFPASCVI